MSIKVGDHVRNTITGFEGIVIGRTEWLNGCARIGIQHQTERDKGLPVDPYWCDEIELEIVEAKQHKPKRATGGPRDDAASRRPDGR